MNLELNRLFSEFSAFFPPNEENISLFNKRVDNLGCERSIIGKSILGRDINLFRMGCGHKSIIFVGAHHGSEYITASVLHFLIYYLSVSDGKELGICISHLFSSYTVFIVPLLNPDGVSLCLEGAKPSPLFKRQMNMSAGQGFSKWQANARGVDLNHNYSFGFREYKAIEAERGIIPGRSLYSGEYPESEPESRSLANLVRAVAPSLIVSLHSQGEEIYYSPRDAGVSALANYTAELLGYRASVPEGTAAFGGLCDYTGGELNIPSMTLEIGKGENPLPGYLLPYLCKSLIPTLLKLIMTA